MRATILLLIIVIASPIPAKQNKYDKMIGTWYYITDDELFPIAISKKEGNYYLRWVMSNNKSKGLDAVFGPMMLAPILQYNRMFKVNDGYECSVFIMNEEIYHHVYFKGNKLYMTLSFIKNQQKDPKKSTQYELLDKKVYDVKYSEYTKKKEEEAEKEKLQRQKEALKHKSRMFELAKKMNENKISEDEMTELEELEEKYIEYFSTEDSTAYYELKWNEPEEEGN